MHAIKRYGAAAAVIMASLLLLLSACMRAPSLSEVLDRDIIKDEGQPYSIYFGRLDEPRQAPVSIRFWDAENVEEVLVQEASVLNIEDTSLWYMVFDHRYEKLFDVIDQQDNG